MMTGRFVAGAASGATTSAGRRCAADGAPFVWVGALLAAVPCALVAGACDFVAGALVAGALVTGALVPCAEAPATAEQSARIAKMRTLLPPRGGVRARSRERRLRDVRLNLEARVQQRFAWPHAICPRVSARGEDRQVHRRHDARERTDVAEELRDPVIRAGHADFVAVRVEDV